MRLADIVGEAARNLWLGVTRPIILTFAFILVIGGITALDLRVLVDANAQLDHWRQSGASIVIATAPGSIDGAACEALASTRGITASGAGRDIQNGLPLPVLPLGSPALAEVTPGFARLIATTAGGSATDRAATPASLARGGLLLSDSLAAAVDRGPGSIIATSGGPAQVAGAYAVPDDGRQARLSYSALAQVPAQGVFDYCWAEIWPPSESTASLLRSTAATSGDATVTVGQLNSTLGSALDADGLYTHRLTRNAPLGAALGGLLLGFIGVRLRRLELASALHAGVTRTALTLQVMIETTLWLAAALLVLAPVIWVAANLGNPLPATLTVQPAYISLAAGTLGTLTGALTGLTATREDHLFAYFKNR